MGVLSSCGCGISDPGIDGLSSSLYREEENWSSIELVRALHPYLLAIDQCIDHHLTLVQIWAKWRLNHGSATPTSIIFLVNAFGVTYAVAFSKIHLHSFKISGNALAVLFVISICPFGRPRTVATSSAVIWIFGITQGLVALQPWLVFLEVPLSEGHHHLPWWCHPLHPFAPGCQPRLLGQVVLLQSTLSGADVLVQWVAALVALVLALQWLFGTLCLLMCFLVLLPFSCCLHEVF
nr:hypothetical protein Iba_chr05bCG6190 [Ipomoea batatas]